MRLFTWFFKVIWGNNKEEAVIVVSEAEKT